MTPEWTAATPALAAEWEALAERVRASPFLRPGWIEAWWRAFGAGRLALLAVRRADGELAALLPLASRRGALTSPTNWHSVEFGPLADSDEARRALFDELFRARARRVSLAFLPSDQAELVARTAALHGRRVLRRTSQRSPYVPLAGGWEAYEAGLGRNLRGDLRRRRRLLEKRGELALEVWDGAELAQLDARLAEGFAIEAAGWKGERGTAIVSQAKHARFYGEVARWAAARGWLRLAFLRLDGRALAFDFALEHGGVHSMLKTGYDPAFQALSPGKVLRGEMIARAFRAGLGSYELLGGLEPWKALWTSHARAREVVQAFRPSALGWLDWSVCRYGRPLAKGLRDRARGRRPAAEAETETETDPVSVHGEG